MLTMLLNHSDIQEKETQQAKDKKIEQLAKVLSLKDVVLKNCKNKNITKTCRKVIETMYPNRKSRAKKRISKMCPLEKEAIHRNYRIRDYNFIINFEYFPEFPKLMHPTESNTPTYVLNNAIGNVFSTT